MLATCSAFVDNLPINFGSPAVFHCQICRQRASTLELHPEFVSPVMKLPLLLYVLDDITSEEPRTVLGRKDGSAGAGGTGLLIICGRGNHS